MSLYLPGNARHHDTPLPKRPPYPQCNRTPQPSQPVQHTLGNPIRRLPCLRIYRPRSVEFTGEPQSPSSSKVDTFLSIFIGIANRMVYNVPRWEGGAA